MAAPPDRYTHGHHESVLRSHRWRSVENSAAFLVPRLEDGLEILDLGCGPGTISADLARRVPHGRVTGVDRSEEIIEGARRLAEQEGLENLSFETGDCYELPYAERSFDLVYAHQLLQHLSDPVAALVEMRRLLRPDGLLAVRDSDYGAFVWYPDDARLDRWLELYHQVTGANHAEADAGRRLHVWVDEAGFGAKEVSSSTWTFQSAEERAWWGQLWADRVRHSSFADQALEYGLSDDAELEELARAFLAWSEDPEGLFIVVHGEVLARPSWD
jgi:SAM-dependent methyltransferase